MPLVRFIGGPLDGRRLEVRRLVDVYLAPGPMELHEAVDMNDAAEGDLMPPLTRYDLRPDRTPRGRMDPVYVASEPHEPVWRLCSISTCLYRHGVAVPSPDAMSVSFSTMSEEAEREMAAWDELLHKKGS